MSQYLEKRENCFYVSQSFGYALSDHLQDCISNKSAILIKQKESTISDKKSIFSDILNSMIFSSHYIENSKFYKDFKSFSKQYYQSLNKDQRDNYDDELEDNKKFDVFSSYFEGSCIHTSTDIYKMPYLLEGEQLGMHVESQSWIVYEDGIRKEYPMMTRYLSCLLHDNGDYIHIEPEFGASELQTPYVEENKKDVDKARPLSELFRLSRQAVIDDALILKVLEII